MRETCTRAGRDRHQFQTFDFCDGWQDWMRRSIWGLISVFNRLPSHFCAGDVSVSCFQSRLTELARSKCRMAFATGHVVFLVVALDGLISMDVYMSSCSLSSLAGVCLHVYVDSRKNTQLCSVVVAPGHWHIGISFQSRNRHMPLRH